MVDLDYYHIYYVIVIIIIIIIIILLLQRLPGGRETSKSSWHGIWISEALEVTRMWQVEAASLGKVEFLRFKSRRGVWLSSSGPWTRAASSIVGELTGAAKLMYT